MSLIDYTALSPEVGYPENIAFVFVGGPLDGEVLGGKTREDVYGVLMRHPHGSNFYSLQGFLNNGSGVNRTQAIYEWGQEKCQNG